MNYVHAFHAGNFADVHKHMVLTLILRHLRSKPAAFRVIDTHAGAGRYDLLGPEAARAGEWRDGIARVFPLRQSGADAAVAADNARALFAPYLDIVASLNAGGKLRLYPGSPLIVKVLLRAQDRLIACELEPRAAASLKMALRGEARAKVLPLDGWMGLNANVPPKERRGIVLIDPPYEKADDFDRLSGAFAQAYRKWPTGLYLLWYPIKAREAADALARRLRRLGMAKIMRCELLVGEPRADAGLVGSGLILANPPYPLLGELEVLLPTLARLFGPDSSHRVDWLARE
jgi:23S rRNA (adenine2030-N6)-methyltransferase